MVFEMMRGESLARHHRSIVKASAEDSVPIGWWSNGLKKYPVETVTMITPNMASRWLGFLNSSEHWTYGDLRWCWNKVASNLSGKITFVVQVCAFPKNDRLELDSSVDADVRSLNIRRCILTYAKPDSRGLVDTDNLRPDRTDATEECQVTPLALLSGDDWNILMEPHWTALAPCLSALKPEGTCAPSPYDFAVGDYHTEFFLVQAPLSEELVHAPWLTLWIMGSRERHAFFPLRRTSPGSRRSR